MPQFVIAYRGGDMPESPEEGAKQKEGWGKWLGGLGDAVVNPGTPLGQSKVVSSNSVTDPDPANHWSGYTVVKADNLDAAIAMAQSCPFLDINGKLEVAEIMDMGDC